MKIEKALVVPGRPEEVWEVLWDVSLGAGCIRGASDVVTIEDRRAYSAVMTQKIGPFTVRFPLSIQVLEAVPPTLLTIVASGRDTRIASGMKTTMRLRLEPAGDNETALAIDTDVTLQGKLASLGQGLINGKADEELEHFRTCLSLELTREQPDG